MSNQIDSIIDDLKQSLEPGPGVSDWRAVPYGHIRQILDYIDGLQQQLAAKDAELERVRQLPVLWRKDGESEEADGNDEAALAYWNCAESLETALALQAYQPGHLTLKSLKGLAARIEMDADPVTDLGAQCRASLPALKEMIARLESRPRPIPLDEVLAEFAADSETKAAMEQAKEGLKAAIARGEKVFEAKGIVYVAVQEKK